MTQGHLTPPSVRPQDTPRGRQIILLIGSRFDYDYQPETFTGKVVRRAATAGKGGTPSHWQTCPHCDAGSRRNRFGKLEPCDHCDGVGRIRVDDYTGDAVVTDEHRDIQLGELIRRDTKTVRCPDCQDLAGIPTGVIRGRPCRRCNGTGQAPIPGSWLSEPADPDRATRSDAIDAMLAALERKQHAGSYRELDQALASVIHHVNKPLRFQAVTSHAGEALRLLDDLWLPPATRDQADLTAHQRDLVDLTLEYLDTQMPDPIRVPAAIVRNAQERDRHRTRARGVGAPTKTRDQEIRKLARQGKPVQWIAAEYGLSLSTVYAITKNDRTGVRVA